MTTLVDTLNTTRENTISLHYDAALTELKEKVKNEPLRTNFHIRAGCVSDEESVEITRRLNANGIKAAYVPKGFFSSRFIDVTVSLPPSLVTEDEKVEATKSETTPVPTSEEKVGVSLF
jgi:hypothetical protein